MTPPDPGVAVPVPDFRSLFEAAPGLFLVLDPNLRVVAASDAWLRLAGARRADILGREVVAALPAPASEGADAALIASLGRVLRERVEDAMPIQARRVLRPREAGGGFEIRWFRSLNRPVLNPDGSVAYLIHSLEEGTGRLPEQAGAGVCQPLDCELLVACARDAFWDWDVPNRRVHFSAQWKALRGYADGEIGDSEEEWSSRIHAEDAPRVLAAVQAHFEGGTEVFSEEYRIRCKDGSWKWILDRGVARRDGAGRVVRMVGSEHEITARKRIEEALRESEERFRTMADGLPLMIWVQDAEGRQQFVNRTYCEFFGLGAGEAGGERWRTLMHPEDAEAYDAELMRATRERRPFHREVRVRRADGAWRWIESWGRPRASASGEVLGLVGASADITERKQAEQALARSEARYRELVQNANSAIIRWRCDGTLTFFNEYAETLFGWQAQEVIGRHVGLLVPDQDSSGGDLSGLVRDITAHPERYTSNLNENRCRDGRRIWMVWTNKPVLDDEGEVVEILAVGSDITEQRRAIEALTRSEARFRRLADANLVGVGIGDGRGRVTYVNDEMLRMMGRSRADYEAGRINWMECLAPELRPEAPDWDAQLRREGRLDGYERAFLCPDGRRIDFTGAAAILDPASGEHVSIALDITARKRDEEALREADRRKDEFLATLGHELRNPLAPLKACLDLLAHGPTDPTIAAEAQAMMSRQVSHMMRLVDDLLEVSRITRAVIELRREAVDFREIAETAVATSAPVVAAAGCRLSLDLPSVPLPLEADPVRLVQVMTNLLNNAAKFSPAGGEIRLAATVAAGELSVSVRDQGRGIAPDLLPRVFEMFIQGEPGREGGLGIGLTLVRSLVQLHGGRVEARSGGAGKGSELVVWLPLAQSPIASAAVGVETPAVDRARAVLVVDDNRDAADSLAMLLRLLGAHVRVVYDGEAALAACSAHQPDLVFLDLGMPGMDGLEVARRLRERAPGQSLTLVAVTGWGQEEDRRRVRDAGFDGHLVKPVDAAQLRRVLAADAQLSEMAAADKQV